MMLNEHLLADIVERVHNRFYGKFRGVVTQVDGPTMRIKARVPAVLGEQECGWATPCVPYAGKDVGIAFLPEAGAGVWIEFEGGDVSFPIWVGCFWHTGEVPKVASDTARAIVTKSATIVFDDENSQFSWSDPNKNSVALEPSGMTIASGSKNVTLGSSGVAVNDGALEVS
ncbi:MAG: phage baseplate assembly protein V [Gammaproteobacteria bacterium]